MLRPLRVAGWWQVDPADGPALLALVADPGTDLDHTLDAEVAGLAWLARHGLGPRPAAPPAPSVLQAVPDLANPGSGPSDDARPGGPALPPDAPDRTDPTDRTDPADLADRTDPADLAHRTDPADPADLTDRGRWYDRARWYERLSGWPADGPENQVQGAGLLEGLGRALRRLHELPVDGSLPVVGIGDVLAEAAARVAVGAVDREQFAPARRRLEPQRLLDQLRALEPVLERRRPVAPVVTHGSCRLGAVWLERTEPTGFIGAARLAVADPYRDLGAMARSLAAVFGAEALPGFFAAYGLSEPDPIRLEFHALLDELL